MWNKSIVSSLGVANLKVTNLKTGDKQEVKFVIVPGEFDCLLALRTVQHLNLVTLNTEISSAKLKST